MQFTKYSLLLGILLTGSAAWSLEGSPTSINVQGKLTATGGGPVTAGNYTFAFRLFDVPAGGTQAWPPAGSENHILALGTDGLWTALLGKDFALLSNVLDDTARYLEITITPPVGSAETFTRVRMSSTPFTLEAAQLNGRTGDAYVETAGDVMTGRLQIDYGSNGTDIDLRQDGGSAAIVELSSGGAMKCQLVADTKGHLVLADNSGDVTAILDATPSAGGVLDLNQEDGTDGALLSGGTTSNGATLDLNNSGGAVAVSLDAQEALGGALRLYQEDGTSGALFLGGSTAGNGALLQLRNAAGVQTVLVDADEPFLGEGSFILNRKETGTVSAQIRGGSSTNGSDFQLHALPGYITVYMDAQETEGGLLELLQEDQTDGATIRGGNTADGATIELRNSGGSVAATLDAQEAQGGLLRINKQDGSGGTELTGGTAADGASLQLRHANGSVTALLDAYEGSNGGNLVLNKENGNPGCVLLGGAVVANGAELWMYNAAGTVTISAVAQGGRLGINTGLTAETNLQVDGGTDASLADGSGYMEIGGQDGLNMVMDNNEIQVRNNGAATSMFLQASGGAVGIGTSTTEAKLDVNESGATVAVFNRNTDDGTVISIQQADTQEGTISVSGTTVSYNAFTGSHYGCTDQTLEKGALVVMTGDNRNLHDAPGSEVIYGIAQSTQANDPRCLGAYLSLSEPSQPAGPENPHLVMAVGNGEMWVANSGESIEIGDYLISSDVAGHAMKEDGRFPVSYIIARAAESVDWAQTGETTGGTKHRKISVLFESFVRDRASSSRQLATRVAELEDALDEQTAELENLKQIVNALSLENEDSETEFVAKP